MIEQVRLAEVYAVGGVPANRVVFAFGTHPMATADDAHAVTTAQARSNKLRIIVDELLRGNDLEELECRYPVDEDAFARVPVGATPDDVARCAVAQDLLPARCPGSNPLSLCICQLDAGCPSGLTSDGNASITPRGASVGVLDRDQDGAADVTQFIAGAAGITCGTIVVPIDLKMSYWTPSGNQQKPAQGGFDALGPAVVVVPSQGLPTSMECGVTFAPSVVDKDGNQVCAPPGGDITLGCNPGDTSAPRFTVEPLVFSAGPQSGSRIDDVKISATAQLDAASLAGVTVTEGAATSYTQFTATLSTPTEITIHWTAAGGLAPMTQYTITVPSGPAGVLDIFHQPAPERLQLAFTTGA